MLALHAENIIKYYGDRLILDISDIKIYSGDRVGLIGTNGCGKTTFLDILTGKIQPDEVEKQPRSLNHPHRECIQTLAFEFRLSPDIDFSMRGNDRQRALFFYR